MEHFHIVSMVVYHLLSPRGDALLPREVSFESNLAEAIGILSPELLLMHIAKKKNLNKNKCYKYLSLTL